jgi:peptidoglycan hydrolase CwlO-like protein
VEEDVEIQQLEKENSALQLDIDSLREELSALNEKQNRRGTRPSNA